MDFEPAYHPLGLGDSALAAAHLDGRSVPGRFAAVKDIPCWAETCHDLQFISFEMQQKRSHCVSDGGNQGNCTRAFSFFARWGRECFHCVDLGSVKSR